MQQRDGREALTEAENLEGRSEHCSARSGQQGPCLWQLSTERFQPTVQSPVAEGPSQHRRGALDLAASLQAGLLATGAAPLRAPPLPPCPPWGAAPHLWNLVWP